MWKEQLEKRCIVDNEEVRLRREFFTRDGLTVAKELLGKILVHETSVGVIRGVITEVESYMGVNDKGSHTYGGRRTERTEPMFHIGGTSYVYFTYGMYFCMNITSGQEGDPQAVLIRSVEPADEESKERMLLLRTQVAQEKALKRKVSKQQKEMCRWQERSQVGAEIVNGVGHATKVEVELLGHTEMSAEFEPLVELTERERLKMHRDLLKHLADGPGKMCIAMGITKADNDVDMIESNSFYVTEGIEIRSEEIKLGKRIGIDYAEEAADYLWRFYL